MFPGAMIPSVILRGSVRRLLASTVALATAATLLHGPAPAEAADKNDWKAPAVTDRPAAKGKRIAAKAAKANPAWVKSTAAPAVRWPEAGSVDVTVGAKPARLGGLTVAATSTPAASGRSAAHARDEAPTRLRVQALDRTAGASLGATGPVLRVNRADLRPAPGQMRLTFGYKDFAAAVGGDYGARLRLLRLPECALTTPTVETCTKATPVPAVNNTADGTLTADLRAAGGAAASDLFAITAGPSSSQGSYTATKATPSSEWSVSGSSGAFTWSYPMRMPPVPGGLGPEVALNYSSQAIDGRTAATNNQGSWIGDGFTYEPGYIERRYNSCKEDGHKNSADLCWARDSLTIVLGGRSSELVKTGDNLWKLANDDGSRVKRLTGAENGDHLGEYFQVTTSDGVQYFLGLNRLPGWSDKNDETHSVWTVPVFHDDKDEECHDDTFAKSACARAWRWNLDYVKDPHKNVASYFYGKEENHYAKNGKTNVEGTAYVRGGYLKRIDYGQRDGAVYSTPAPARVVFHVEERCKPTETFKCREQDLTDDAAGEHFPDVPWDQHCAKDAKCKLHQAAPTFWTRKRLHTVTTQIRGKDDWTPVDRWTLDHDPLSNGDGSRTLWLSAITHSGHVGGTTKLPSVQLHAVQRNNRIARPNDNIGPLVRLRLTTINTDAGAQVDIHYQEGNCSAGNLPKEGHSTQRCFPVKWHPNDNDEEPKTDWFHKYVVDEIVETDLVSDAPDMVTHYDYIGDAGWRRTDPDGVTDDKYLTWSQWRGYKTVRERRGSVGALTTRVDTTYFRGMHGDKDPGGGTRPVDIQDSTGKEHTDHDELVGMELEKVAYDGGDVVSKTITSPWRHETAEHKQGDITQRAFVVRPGSTRTFTALEAGGWRETKTVTTYDTTTGRVKHADDLGDVDTAADDQCTRSWYADSPTDSDKEPWRGWRITRVETVSVNCATPPDRRTQVLSDKLTHYDGLPHGTFDKGNATKIERLASHDGTTAKYITVTETKYDAWGREERVEDAEKNVTRTHYTHANGLLIQKRVVNAENHDAVTEYAPAWGLPRTEIDPNLKRTDLAYDPLGRLTSVWLPDRDKKADQTPNVKYTYLHRKDLGVTTKTETIETDGSYDVEYELYDGHVRLRQTQEEGPDGGRLVTDTLYNSTGQTAQVNHAYYAAGRPDDVVMGDDDGSKVINNGDVDGQTVYLYDGAGRLKDEIAMVSGQERWRTRTDYGGDRVHIDPPAGGTPKTTLLDARDRPTELRQYKNREKPAGEFTRTKYRYTPAGDLELVTDAAGNQWSYRYDQLGRKAETVDPDAGRSTFGYDKLDRLVKTTDDEDNTLIHEYDGLSRKVATYVGEKADKAKIVGWTYDAVDKGQLYSAVRYVDGKTYATVYPVRDAYYRPTRTTYVIPDHAGAKLQRSYDFTTDYNRDGTIRGIGMPEGGGLPAEGVTFDYDAVERPISMSGLNPYVTSTSYEKTGALRQVEMNTGGKKAVFTWTYDKGTNRLAASRVDRQGAGIVDMDAHYTYDQAGNVLSIIDKPDGGQRDVQCFTHDYLQRLTEAWTTRNTATDPCSGGPGTSGVGGPAAYHHSYAYDAAGNRENQTIHATTPGAATTTRTYAYPAKGGPRKPGEGGPHALASVTTTDSANSPTASPDTYAYDEVGNTVARKIGGREQTLTWDAEGHLTSVTEAGKTTSFVYGPDGERLLRKEPTATTLYLPGMELRLNHGNQAVDATRYYTFGGRTVAMRTTTGVRFLASDHHGTALLAIDAASGALTRRRTAPFGTIRGDAPQQWPGDKGFVGGTQDGTTGLTHLGAREYDPTVGRFISVDPLVEPSDPQQLQGYSYANNNPVTLSDPTGLRPDDGGSGRRGGNQSSYHNIALFWMRLMAYWYLQVMQGMRGEITTDLGKGGKTRNTIPRAHKSGDNKRPGVADMIFWGEDVVYVWEVKPNTLDELNKGRVQLNRYIQKLQDKLRAAGDHRRVRPGPWLPPGRGLPVGNGKVLDVWSDHRRPGMLIYGSRSAPKHSPPPNGPRPVPVPEPKLREVPVPGQPAQPRTLPQPHAHPNGPYGTCPGPGCARPSDGYLEDRWHWDPPNVSAQEVAGGVGTVAAVVACLILCLLNPAMA